MIVAIHQAEHLPWYGYFHKMKMADVFVILDNVQFKKNYFENRNRIYTPQGLKYITAPVKMKGHLSKKFYEIELVDNWKKKYVKTLEFNYKKAPYFEDIRALIDEINNYSDNNLFNLNMLIIEHIKKLLDIDIKLIKATDLDAKGYKTELLIDILIKLKADSYIVGKSGFDYMNLELFEKNNISLIKHQVQHPLYKPFNYKKFTDYPSIIDVIANLGKENIIKFF
jgi:hypothetical protein